MLVPRKLEVVGTLSCFLTLAQHPPKMSEKLLTMGTMAAMVAKYLFRGYDMAKRFGRQQAGLAEPEC